MVSFCQSFHSINDSLFEHLDDVKISFFKDTLDFLTYNTEAKPFPFDDNIDAQVENKEDQDDPVQVNEEVSEEKAPSN